MGEAEKMAETTRVTIIQSLKELDLFVALALELKRVGYDIEGSGLRPERGARICGYGVGLGPRDGFYVPVRHERSPEVSDSAYDVFVNLPPDKVIRILEPLLVSDKVSKVGANLQFDTKHTDTEGVRMVRPRDVQALIRIVLPKLPRVEGERGPYGLKALKQSILHEHTGERDELREWLVSRGLPEHAIHLAPIGIAGTYCVDDSTAVLRLLDKVLPLAKKDAAKQRAKGADPSKRGTAFLWRLENELIPVVADIETAGFPVDETYLQELYTTLGDEVNTLEAEAFDMAGEKFNPRSHKQVSALVYTKFGLKCVEKTKSGARSTSADGLKLAALVSGKGGALVDKILEARLTTKLRNTYVKGKKGKSILENTTGGKVYGEIRPDGARSGRLSASSPNLTNLPKRKSKRVRHAFWAGDPDYVLVSFDQSQVEPRLLGHYSKAPSLLNAFIRGLDVYRQMAVDAGLNEKTDDVSGATRRLMKTFVLGLNYRMGPKSLAKRMTLETGKLYRKKDAACIMDTYFGRVPEVKAFHMRCDNAVEVRGYISTLFGRKRYLDSDQAFIGTNHVIQGSAAELFKLAMVRVGEFLRDKLSEIVVVIHDDILVRMHKSEVYMIPKIVDCLTQFGDVVSLRVPMEANVTIYDTDPEGRWVGGRELTMTEILSDTFALMQDRLREKRKKAGILTTDEAAIMAMEKKVSHIAPELFLYTTDLRDEVKAGWKRGESAEEFVEKMRELESKEDELMEAMTHAS
jgi:DNA polymerase-1